MSGDDCACPQCIERRRLHSAPELEAGAPYLSPTDARRAEERVRMVKLEAKQ